MKHTIHKQTTHGSKKRITMLKHNRVITLVITVVLCIFAVSAWAAFIVRPTASTATTADFQTENATVSNSATIGNDTSASGGKYVAFSTIAPTTPFKLMPLGDSITLGWNYYPGTSLPPPGGYRTLLWQRLVQQDQKSIDFVGTLSSGPTELGDKNHEGHSGWRIDQIRANIDSYLASAQPDAVLLSIGTNDVVQNYDLANAPARLQDLVDRICTNRPAAQIVVSSIPPRPGLDSTVNNYNSKIPAIVAASQGKGCRTTFFNMNAAMASADIAPSDNTHPTMAGYDKMANAWYPVVANLYNSR